MKKGLNEMLTRSISRKAARAQVLRLYAYILKERDGIFNPQNATRRFRMWFNSQKDQDKDLVAVHVQDVLEEIGKKTKLVEQFLETEGYSKRRKD